MTTGQRNWFYAAINRIWPKGVGEYIVYALMIARFGKSSTKGLTQGEIDWLFDWIEQHDQQEQRQLPPVETGGLSLTNQQSRQ